MTGLFLKIVNMGITAGWLILAVLAFRLLFRKAPKWMNPALWGLAGVRLIMPFSIESVFSLIPRTEVIRPDVILEPAPAAELPQLYPVRYDPEDILANMDTGTEDPESLFADGQPLEFLFASGAGGWGTTLTLHPDGSFEGEYHDSDMGVNAPEYPNGTIYICKFSGRFSEMIRETEHSYSMTLQELTYEETGREWIEDQVRFVAAEPYGMIGEEFILYLPGTPAEQLNEEFLDWWPDAHLWRAGSLDRLTGYGLYNCSTGQGFCTSWLQ